MKSFRPVAIAAVLAALFAAPVAFPPAAVAADAAAVQPQASRYPRIVNADFVAKYAVLPKPDGVQIVELAPGGPQV